MLSFCNQSIKIIRPGTKTVRGSVVPDWEHTADPVTVTGCSVQPAATTLSEDGRVLGLSDGLTVYVPSGTDVKAGDHIEVDGETYEINGVPRNWTSPTGRVSNIQLNLKRYSG